MKKLAILMLLALEIAVSGCGTNTTPTTTINTSTTGNWEAQLTGGIGPASLLNFVTTFTVYNSGPLNITGFSFFNAGSCFATGVNTTTETGSITNLFTGSTGAVTGTLNFAVTSTTTGSVLTLTNGQLTGTSNGTTTTNGTLSQGVVVGNWSLSPGSGAPAECTGSGNFIMCQGTATCTTTGT